MSKLPLEQKLFCGDCCIMSRFCHMFRLSLSFLFKTDLVVDTFSFPAESAYFPELLPRGREVSGQQIWDPQIQGFNSLPQRRGTHPFLL